jgi:hypothetical protein
VTVANVPLQAVPHVTTWNVWLEVGVKPLAVMIESVPPRVAVAVTFSCPYCVPGVVPASTTSSVAPAGWV